MSEAVSHNKLKKLPITMSVNSENYSGAADEPNKNQKYEMVGGTPSKPRSPLSPINKRTETISNLQEQTMEPQVKIKHHVVINPSPVPDQRNVATMCKIRQHDKTTSSSVVTSDKETQTDQRETEKILIPVPIFIFIPLPLPFYSIPVPYPLPFPLPIPVPLFIPTTRNSAEKIMKDIIEIRDKTPNNLYEAELLTIAEMIAGDEKEQNTNSESNPGEESFLSLGDANITFGDDILEMALDMVTELEEPAVDFEEAITANTITAPQESETTTEKAVTSPPIINKKQQSLRSRKRTARRGQQKTVDDPLLLKKRQQSRKNKKGAAREIKQEGVDDPSSINKKQRSLRDRKKAAREANQEGGKQKKTLQSVELQAISQKSKTTTEKAVNDSPIINKWQQFFRSRKRAACIGKQGVDNPLLIKKKQQSLGNRKRAACGAKQRSVDNPSLINKRQQSLKNRKKAARGANQGGGEQKKTLQFVKLQEAVDDSLMINKEQQLFRDKKKASRKEKQEGAKQRKSSRFVELQLAFQESETTTEEAVDDSSMINKRQQFFKDWKKAASEEKQEGAIQRKSLQPVELEPASQRSQTTPEKAVDDFSIINEKQQSFNDKKKAARGRNQEGGKQKKTLQSVELEPASQKSQTTTEKAVDDSSVINKKQLSFRGRKRAAREEKQEGAKQRKSSRFVELQLAFQESETTTGEAVDDSSMINKRQQFFKYWKKAASEEKQEGAIQRKSLQSVEVKPASQKSQTTTEKAVDDFSIINEKQQFFNDKKKAARGTNQEGGEQKKTLQSVELEPASQGSQTTTEEAVNNSSVINKRQLSFRDRKRAAREKKQEGAKQRKPSQSVELQSASQKSETTTKEAVDDFSMINKRQQLLADKKRAARERKQEGAKRKRTLQLVKPQPVASVEKSDTHLCLKYFFGVSAWKKWITMKNAELIKSNRYVLPFKTEILKLAANELNYLLCLFVNEVRNPNGDEYTPDTIYYLCLGIQKYLFENNRNDHIFCDPAYEQFIDCFDKIAKKFSVNNDSQYIATRIEEEHLWETKQLGAHSPHVLLSTLIFFNTKYFNLSSVQEHMQLSFSHIIKYPKRNSYQPGSPKNVFLRFYPPESAMQNNPKKKEYKQEENNENPLRCPVKLYEFYLSKCPDSVKTRTDVFYLQPERSCVPRTPVWYSTTAAPEEVLEKMLRRVKMVKEINVALLTS